MKKLSRKQIRRMLLEQPWAAPVGPFLVMVVDRNYGEVNDVFITKILPERDWWHSDEGGGYGEDLVINIQDMSSKTAVPGEGLPGGKIVFRSGFFDEIKHPEAY